MMGTKDGSGVWKGMDGTSSQSVLPRAGRGVWGGRKPGSPLETFSRMRARPGGGEGAGGIGLRAGFPEKRGGEGAGGRGKSAGTHSKPTGRFNRFAGGVFKFCFFVAAAHRADGKRAVRGATGSRKKTTEGRGGSGGKGRREEVPHFQGGARKGRIRHPRVKSGERTRWTLGKRQCVVGKRGRFPRACGKGGPFFFVSRGGPNPARGGQGARGPTRGRMPTGDAGRTRAAQRGA